MEVIGNPLAARQLILKSLYTNPKNKNLWTELLFLEFRIQSLISQREQVVDKVIKEKMLDEQIVQNNINTNKIEEEDQANNDEEEEEFMNFDDEDEDIDASQIKQKHSFGYDKNLDVEWILEEIKNQFKDDLIVISEIILSFKNIVNEYLSIIDNGNNDISLPNQIFEQICKSIQKFEDNNQLENISIEEENEEELQISPLLVTLFEYLKLTDPSFMTWITPQIIQEIEKILSDITHENSFKLIFEKFPKNNSLTNKKMIHIISLYIYSFTNFKNIFNSESSLNEKKLQKIIKNIFFESKFQNNYLKIILLSLIQVCHQNNLIQNFNIIDLFSKNKIIEITFEGKTFIDNKIRQNGKKSS